MTGPWELPRGIFRRHSTTVFRLLGIGILFAVAMPQHGSGRTSEYIALRGTELPVAIAATGSDRRLVAVSPSESTRLRALRSNEADLFKSLPEGARSCEGSACRGDQPAREDDASWMANLRMPEIPVKPNERIRQYVEYFTENAEGRRIFRSWLKRSGRYSKTVSAQLRELLLPQDLQAVVFVESGYSPTAVSTAGAVGLWQLMAATARVYGLAVESDLDERRSIERSSQAAVKHLSDMRDRFGSWELALAAYNMGYKALIDRIKDVSTNDFWTLSQLEGVLPRETQLYVPKVLAAALILRNLDRFGFDDTRIDPPSATGDIDVPAGTSLSLVARAAGTSVKTLRELNPELLSDIVPDRGRTFAVHVPSSGIGRAQTVLPRLLDRRDRDGLERGASDDFDWGRDDSPRKSGRRTDFYGDDRAREEAPRVARSAPRGDDEGTGKANSILYRVGENETIGAIAKSFGTTTSQIIEDNYLDPDGKLQKGMLLVLEVSPRSMNRIMKKRAQTRIDDAEGAPRNAEPGVEDDGRMSPRKGPGAYPDADLRSNGSRG